MDLQDVLGLEAEEDISYEDCLHDQELSFVASMECCSVDFNSDLFKSRHTVIMCWFLGHRMLEIKNHFPYKIILSIRRQIQPY